MRACAPESRSRIFDERVRGGRSRPPRRGTIPSWLERIIARGAARTPGERFATAGELVATLDRGRHARRRRWLAAGGAAAVLGAGLTFALAGRVGTSPDPCAHSADDAAAVWTASSRVALARALASDPASAQTAADDLDRRLAAWDAMRIEACKATKVRGSQSDALLDRRNACLDRRLDEVRALVTRASEGARAPARVVDAIEALPPLATCADTRALEARVPPPEDVAVRRRVDELNRTLDDAWALEELGRYDAGLAVAGPLRDAAHAAGYLPLEAETLALLSALHQDKGEEAPAEALLREMVTVAARAKDDVPPMRTRPSSTRSVVDAGARRTEALQFVPVAEAAALRANNPRSTIKVMRNSAIGPWLELATMLARIQFGERSISVLRAELVPETLAQLARGPHRCAAAFEGRPPSGLDRVPRRAGYAAEITVIFKNAWRVSIS